MKTKRTLAILGLVLVLVIGLVSMSFGRMPLEDPRLVGHWPLDEGNGVIAHDNSGNSNNGTLVGAPIWEEGPSGFGGALQFDGHNYVEIDGNQVFEIIHGITLAAWIRIPRWTCDWQTICSRGDWSWRLHRNSLGGMNNGSCSFHMTGMHDGWGANGSVTVTDDEWHHVVGTWDGYRAKIYIDGVLNDDQPRTGSIGNEGDDPVTIGAQIHDGQLRRQFIGCIDDVRVYNRALSRAEVNGLLCTTFMPQDLNQDCYVDMHDFAMFASGWLNCANTLDPACMPHPDYPKDEGAIVPGTYCECEIADEITVAFPERLGGEVQTTTFVNKEVLFIEDPPPGATEARIWVSSSWYEVEGLSFLYDIDGDGAPDRVDTGPFVLGRLTPSAVDLKEPPGRLNLTTGEFDLTYGVHLELPFAAELGIEDLGVLLENQQGVIDLEKKIKDVTYSSIGIESVFFDGTEVYYSEEVRKYGLLHKRDPVPVWVEQGHTFWIPPVGDTCAEIENKGRRIYGMYALKDSSGNWLHWDAYIISPGVQRANIQYDTYIKKVWSGKNWVVLPKNPSNYYQQYTQSFNTISPVGMWIVQHWGNKGQPCSTWPKYAVIHLYETHKL